MDDTNDYQDQVKCTDFGFVMSVIEFVKAHPEVVALAREVVALLNTVFSKKA